MFYETQTETERNEYKQSLNVVGRLSRLYSISEEPFVYYRAHESLFCRAFHAEDIGREDCSADAKKNGIGIGLKTWVGGNNQKVAEFGRERPNYEHLDGINLVRHIARLRNGRIRLTINSHGLEHMIYHVVKRVPGRMLVYEHPFNYIDEDNITLIPNRGGANSIYFTDGNHIYNFLKSKNTLYMVFEDLELLDSFDVDIIDDPIPQLVQMFGTELPATPGEIPAPVPIPAELEPTRTHGLLDNQLCLRLYSTRRGEKYVPERSGLNQWNASGRARHADELYIPYQAEDRNRKPNFFPPRDTCFNLTLPDGTIMSAKVCQEADRSRPELGKAIMSNPNKDLGHWLLRTVFELAERELMTYNMLETSGVDSVVFTKHGDLDYSVDFSALGSYERYYYENDEAFEE